VHIAPIGCDRILLATLLQWRIDARDNLASTPCDRDHLHSRADSTDQNQSM